MASVASDLRLGRGFCGVVRCSARGIQLERRRADCDRWVQGKRKLRMCCAKVERDTLMQAEQASKALEQGTTRVKFVLHKECLFGEYFKLTGSDPALGGWDPSAAVALKWSEDHIWTTELELAEGSDYEYKFVLSRINGEDVWQPGPNRQFSTATRPGSLTVLDFWDFNQSSVCEQPETVEEVVVDAVAGEPLHATTMEEAVQDESQCGLEDAGRPRPFDSGQDVQQEPDDSSEEATETKPLVHSENEVVIDEEEVPRTGNFHSVADEAILAQDMEQLMLVKNEEAATRRQTSSECMFQNDIAWIFSQVSRFFNFFR